MQVLRESFPTFGGQRLDEKPVYVLPVPAGQLHGLSFSELRQAYDAGTGIAGIHTPFHEACDLHTVHDACRAAGREDLLLADLAHRDSLAAGAPDDQQHLVDDMTDTEPVFHRPTKRMTKPTRRAEESAEKHDRAVVGSFLRCRNSAFAQEWPPFQNPNTIHPN